jgi:hypothetical protein
MKRYLYLVTFIAEMAALTVLPARAQLAGKYLAPRDQVVAMRAGRLFDARSGTIVASQVVLLPARIPEPRHPAPESASLAVNAVKQ